MLHKTLLAVLGLLALCAAFGAAPASAGTLVITGEDEHCSGNAGSPFCDFTFKIIEYAREQAPDPDKGLLVLDCDNDPNWINDAYNGSPPPLTVVCPGTDEYDAEEFTTDTYSAIAIAAGQADGGVLNPRAEDFLRFTDENGGIITFNAASNGNDPDLDFLPAEVTVSGTDTTSPYFMTEEGTAELGVTDTELNDNYSQHETYEDPEPGSELKVGARDDEGRALILFGRLSVDRDEDGVVNRDDNCPEVANSGQADVDKDGLGDACDDDADGDGLANEQEQGLGIDPLKADTDGDGTPDGLDRCGTRAGTEAGCPTVATAAAAQPAAQPQPQLLPPLVPNRVLASVKKARTARGLRLTTTGEVLLPAGLTPAQACRGAVIVTVKSGKRTVSTRIAELGRDCKFTSTVPFRVRSRLGRRKLSVTALFSGNERIVRRSSSVVDAGRP